MCGIVGLIGRESPVGAEAMNALIAHRGPDDAGAFAAPELGVALAMRRLAILDVHGGHQPMTTPDGRYTIVYNGEVYNAPALRATLEREGERFDTDHSDTEVVLRLYAREGRAALDRLNGMFAFAVLDRKDGTLFCARDRLGIKPFYYLAEPGRFAFASELKALLVLPGVPREIDPQSAFHFFSLLYVPGERTILRSVRRLAPGHWLRVDCRNMRVEIGRWWRLEPRQRELGSRPALQREIRDAIVRAVDRWTLSDVPVACSLSGGLDSSAIVGALASRGREVRTFSLGFRSPAERAWDELPLARKVAERWGTVHQEVVMDPDSLLDELVPMAWHLDEPYAGGLPSWLVFKLMSREVKVGLTGTGGDELFGNYGKWRELEGGLLRRIFGRQVDEARFRREFFERYYYFADDEKRAVLVLDDDVEDTASLLYRRYRESGATSPRDAVACTDIGTQLAEEFLMMTDRFSMAHSLEARTPFLDHELVELVFSVPPRVRTARGDLKGLLRESVRDLLPAELLRAPKRGFLLPLAPWLRGRLRPIVETLLAPGRLAQQGLIRPQFHERYVAPHLAGAADHTQKVWAAFMFQLWHLVFLEHASAERPSLDLRALAE
jgi:asparagine synthase (glutamine-hydrolysing)